TSAKSNLDYHLEIYLDEIYLRKKQELLTKLISVDFLSLTTDSWTSCQNYCCLSLTCHFFDNLKLKTNCLSFSNLVGGHTAENLESSIIEVLDKFNLKDNAANIRRAVLDMDLNHEPIRCIGHEHT
ncbi:zinc finger BED domain-containing 1-like, partial [Brachionus plicatilis]